MGILDEKVTQEEFTTFKNEIKSEINELTQKINHKVSESEENIQRIETDSINILNTLKEKEILIESFITEFNNDKISANKILDSINKNKLYIDEQVTSISNILNHAEQEKESFSSKKETLDNLITNIEQKINELNNFISKAESFPSKLDELETNIENCSKITSDIESLREHSVKKKSDIDKLYNEIHGKDIKNDNGEIEHTDGLKDKLNNTFNDLEDKINTSNENLDNYINNLYEEFQNLLHDSNDKISDLLQKSNNKFEIVSDKLDTLLPGAMAAGLSTSYEKKIRLERKSKKKLEEYFSYSILGLIGVSLIPIGVDIYRLIATDADLVKIIKDTPTLLFSILPIYFPILWFAYSSNKKINLSKRLIEEYTHKASLGKTFEGLSTQIETLSTDQNITNELRTKLLFNLLQVSAENPGKLITDYQRSDHPIMEALDNSAKLTDSIDKLNKIPGFSSLAKKLSDKKEKINIEIEKQVAEGLENISS